MRAMIGIWGALALVACGGNTDKDDASGGGGDGGDSAAAAIAGRCTYVNPFSQGAECKEYTGADWTAEAAGADCAAPIPGAEPGTFEPALTCDRTEILGECVVAGGAPEETILVFPGSDPGACSGVELGCSFAQGVFTPAEACAGGGDDGGGATTGVFQPFERVCRDPLAGEPPGRSEGGKVCTWQAISGATEEGRRYIDYAECAPVFTQRPYWPGTGEPTAAADDPRLADPAWVAEYEWMSAQTAATACVCCHSADQPPLGPSGWSVDAGPIWTDTLNEVGLAVLAGWVDSTAFGAFDPADNNGFDRHTTGIPTTDPARMQAFLAGELAYRGFVEADFADIAPFGGPLYDQLFYEPGPCEAGQGVDSAGVITWTGGGARYLYVLEEGSQSPGVPPNLDLPDGTLWRLDVSPTADPVRPPVVYGDVPGGTRQAFPTSGGPDGLIPGRTYYLVALRDIYQPITRCLFTAE